MKTKSLLCVSKTIDNSLQSSFVSIQSTNTVDLKDQITHKFKTFTRFNYRSALKEKKKGKQSQILRKQSTINNQQMLSYLKNFSQNTSTKTKNIKNVSVVKFDELEGVKAERRERFKKVQNPLQIVQHYINKFIFNPTEEQNIILHRVVKLKEFIDQNQPINIDLTLEKIYKIMNSAVDLNLLRFLILTILMAADITFESKDFVRSFYFYNQAMIATTCARKNTIKIQCLIQMGRIAIELMDYQVALKFFKKALQYCWKMKDTETELRVYDWIGQVYYFQGQAKYGLYYHYRSIQGQLEEADSAVKKISSQMLAEYQKKLSNFEKQNLNQLFIEYLSLPITNFKQYPPIKVKKPYANYSNNQSPRKNKQHRDFSIDSLPKACEQMEKLIQESEEFKTEIPSPDLHQNYVTLNKYGKPRKDVEFQQSNEYHKIIGVSPKKCDPSVYKLSMEEKVQKTLNEKEDPFWWDKMVMRTKKQRQQRLGHLRDTIKKTHLSYNKYPQEKRRANSLKHQKINQSINKTLLNWIDPPKDKFL